MMAEATRRIDGDILIYGNGLLCCSVCAPAEMSIEEVTNAVNAQNPSGLSNGWSLSEDPTFKGGEPMPSPCNVDPLRRHYLFNC